MALFDEQALRELVKVAVREALREERAVRPTEYVSVAEAALIVKVASATIREWMGQGRLQRYHAGRELRVRRDELDQLLASPTPAGASPRVADSSPEAEAMRYLRRRGTLPGKSTK